MRFGDILRIAPPGQQGVAASPKGRDKEVIWLGAASTNHSVLRNPAQRRLGSKKNAGHFCCQEQLDEWDMDESGEIEFPEFLKIISFHKRKAFRVGPEAFRVGPEAFRVGPEAFRERCEETAGVSEPGVWVCSVSELWKRWHKAMVCFMCAERGCNLFTTFSSPKAHASRVGRCPIDMQAPHTLADSNRH